MTATASRPRVQKSDAEWKRELTPAQYHVTREHGTERAFTGPYWNEKSAGTYACVCCGTPLFSSAAKFDSGTGWPSFFAPLAADVVDEHDDRSFFMRRTEVRCLHATHRGALRDLRCASRPRISRRTEADPPALLHERHGPRLRARSRCRPDRKVTTRSC